MKKMRLPLDKMHFSFYNRYHKCKTVKRKSICGTDVQRENGWCEFLDGSMLNLPASNTGMNLYRMFPLSWTINRVKSAEQSAV